MSTEEIKDPNTTDANADSAESAESTALSNKESDAEKKEEGGKDDGKNDSGRFIWSAACCCYTAFDMKNIELCCRYEYDYCCLRHACCLSATSKPLGCGCTGNKEEGDLCKLAAFCCNVGCIKPTACCGSAHACLCCYKVSSFPCSDHFLEKCVCACCCLSCAPKFGCCVEPPACPALDKLRGDASEMEPMKMDRGDDGEDEVAEVAEVAASAPEAAVEAPAEVIAEKEDEGAEEAHA